MLLLQRLGVLLQPLDVGIVLGISCAPLSLGLCQAIVEHLVQADVQDIAVRNDKV